MFRAMPSEYDFLFEVSGRCLRPGLLRARFARFLLRNEPNPTYPYRDNFMLKFYVGDAFIVKIIRARPYGSGFYG